MSSLLYREDIDEVRERLTSWWNGGDIGRPPMLITAPRSEPAERIEAMPEPAGWTGRYSTRDFYYRVNLSARQCVNTHYLAEEVPTVAPDLCPNCLALFLGCHGVEMANTVWAEPFLDNPEEARFEYDPNNFYWDFAHRLGKEQLRIGQGKFLVQFPDLIEGLDTLAAIRGTERLLMDLVERPEWVRGCLRPITDRYFHYYDILYDLFRDEVGGSYWWMWAPGRMAKFQCDFSAMISPDMFGELMVPVLSEMCERISYVMYHWDGPTAIPHHDHLLSVPGLDMIQWTPGAGVEPAHDRRWYPLFHKTVEAGKKAIMMTGAIGVAGIRELKREFGEKLKQIAIKTPARSQQEAQQLMEAASF